jgi:hypothetical protein
MQTSSPSPFRAWMEFLKKARGAEAEWPWLLRRILTDTYLREREQRGAYAGEVFKARDGDFPIRASVPEKKAVKELFHHCRQATNGVLTVGAEPYWLLGYEWPNQGGDREKGCRADLVGLTASGGLAVFECKLKNQDGPLTSVLEGLDYLSHLTARPNFTKVEDGFRRWLERSRTGKPPGFGEVAPKVDAPHELIVLASSDYFALHRRTGRSPGWELFAALPPVPSSALAMRFAVSDFASPQAQWVVG